jgi:hypothetical protein
VFIDLAPGVRVALALPEGAREVQPPAMDLSAVPGAEVSVARAFAAGSLSVYVGCARAPSWLWAEGLETPILAAANAFVKKNLGLESLEIAKAEKAGHVEQTFSGRNASGAALGKHILGTVGDELTLCSIVCTAPDDDCAAVMRGSATTGRFEPPPAPGIFAQAIGYGMTHPYTALTVLGALFVACTALILWRRPRPRP